MSHGTNGAEAVTSVKMRIRGHTLPGRRCEGLPGIAKPCYDEVHVGMQQKHEVVELVPGDAPEARWDFQIDVFDGKDGRPDFRGPRVQGKPGERFLYLNWGEVGPGGTFWGFRRAKLWLTTIDEALIEQAMVTNGNVQGKLPLTDARGGPICASVRPPILQWRLAAE
jgi:hypothetical protein